MRNALSIIAKGALVALFLSMVAVLGVKAQNVTFAKDHLSIQTAGGKAYEFEIELALSDRQREQGLMYRKEMAPDHGMLFDFGVARPVQMWMENTILPLDMLFIGADGRITHIAENAIPFSRDIIDSNGAAKFVLEINAGRARQLGLKVGDKVINKRIGPAG